MSASPQRLRGRARIVWLPIFGVVLGIGAALIYLGLGLGGTPRDQAIAETQALVPPGADQAPVGEFDPPFWYGAIYTINQRFSGGGDDRASLAEAMISQLAFQGWEVSEVEQAPGATLVRASHRDLVSLSHLRGPPSTPTVEGLIEVRYQPRDKLLTLVAGGLVGGALAFIITLFLRLRSRARN